MPAYGYTQSDLRLLHNTGRDMHDARTAPDELPADALKVVRVHHCYLSSNPVLVVRCAIVSPIGPDAVITDCPDSTASYYPLGASALAYVYARNLAGPDWHRPELAVIETDDEGERTVEHIPPHGRDPFAACENWQVIVGNVGTVYDGTSETAARLNFKEYREIADGTRGRAAGESVYLMCDGHEIDEHIGRFDLAENQEPAEEEEEPAPTYEVIKYVRDVGPTDTIHTGLTREEAKEICSSPDSTGEGWFYGFREE